MNLASALRSLKESVDDCIVLANSDTVDPQTIVIDLRTELDRIEYAASQWLLDPEDID